MLLLLLFAEYPSGKLRVADLRDILEKAREATMQEERNNTEFSRAVSTLFAQAYEAHTVLVKTLDDLPACMSGKCVDYCVSVI